MKKLITAILLLSSLLCYSQAHLGLTDREIRSLHQDSEFVEGYTEANQRYIYTKMDLGFFFYFFNKEDNLSDLCLQVPHDMICLNTQIEIYNKKYVVLSETKWKAYLEEGGIMNIELQYSEVHEMYTFVYTF